MCYPEPINQTTTLPAGTTTSKPFVIPDEPCPEKCNCTLGCGNDGDCLPMLDCSIDVNQVFFYYAYKFCWF